MSLFKRKSSKDLSDVAALRAEVTEMHQQLEASEQSRHLLEARIQSLDATTLSLVSRAGEFDEITQRMAEVDVIKRQVAQIDVVNAKLASLDMLNSKLTELAERVTISADDARQAKDQAATLHERISNVSTELANQLGELSREIDGLGSIAATPQPSAMPPPAPLLEAAQSLPKEVVDQLRSSQVKLANEQARYEIAFRQDLAMLAEQVKRSRTETDDL